MTSPSLMHATWHSRLLHWDDQGDGTGREVREGFGMRGTHVMSVLMRWMKLEPIIQSEVSQKEKHQYHILARIYWNLERP